MKMGRYLQNLKSHLGDPSKFPKTTNLIVGPGFKKNFMPGYPKNPDAWLLETDFE